MFDFFFSQKFIYFIQSQKTSLHVLADSESKKGGAPIQYVTLDYMNVFL